MSAGPWLKPRSPPAGMPRHRIHPRRLQSSQSAHTCTQQKRLSRCLHVRYPLHVCSPRSLRMPAELAEYLSQPTVLICRSAFCSAAQPLRASLHCADLHCQDSHLPICELWRIAGINVPISLLGPGATGWRQQRCYSRSARRLTSRLPCQHPADRDTLPRSRQPLWPLLLACAPLPDCQPAQ